jgi:hypothetical protein
MDCLDMGVPNGNNRYVFTTCVRTKKKKKLKS